MANTCTVEHASECAKGKSKATTKTFVNINSNIENMTHNIT